MPISLRSISDKELPTPYVLLQTLRDLVKTINTLETQAAAARDEIATLQAAVAAAQAAATAAGTDTPPTVSPYPAVIVDPNGAILGDGTAIAPLAVSVDNSTVLIVGNQLTAPAAGGGITELTGDVTAGPGAGSEVATITPTGVTPGTYGDATHVAQITVLASGQLSVVADVVITAGTGDVVGPAGAIDDRIAIYDGTTGKLIADGGYTIADILALIGGGGLGDVVGPASAVDDRIATYDGVTGKLIQDGGATIADVLLAAAAGVIGSLTTPRVPYKGASTLLDDTNLQWDVSTSELVVPRIRVTGGAVPATPASGDGVIFAATAGGHTAPSYIDSAGFVLRMTRDLTLLVNNNTASTIVRGRACYFSGASVSNIPTIGLAEADQFDSGVPRAAAGLTLEDIAAGADGVILLSGLISNLDTSLLTQGATVYLSATAGRYSSSYPAAGGSFIQPLGNCTRSHATLGSIELDVEAPATVLIRNLTATRIPFVATGPIFDDDPALTWDDTAKALVLGTGAAPASVPSNSAALYSANVVSTNELFGVNEAGQAVQLTAPLDAITCVFDGGGSVLAAKTVYVEIPYACKVTGWRIVADIAGSAVVDIWKDSYASYPPVVGDSIAGSEKPTLSGVISNEDLNLTTWTDTTIDAGEYLAFALEATPATCTWLCVQLLIRKGT